MNQGDFYICNSKQTIGFFLNFAMELWKDHPYVTFTWRIGEDRSLDQNALFHMWATEYAGHVWDKSKKSVTEGQLLGIKMALKMDFYNETRYEWMVVEAVNPKTGEKYTEYRSSKKYKVKEMFEFLCWVQAKASNNGLILDSKGDFKKRQQKAMGI